MTDFADLKTQIAEYANRQDWADAIVIGFIRQAEQKFNAELRIDRMIKFNQALINCRCIDLPDDWLQMELVRIANPNVPSGFIPIRYKARDEFYTTNDNWMYGFYTIQGRELFIGGTPDAYQRAVDADHLLWRSPGFLRYDAVLGLHEIPVSLSSRRR